MSQPARKLLTVEDLYAVPEAERRHELIAGDIVRKADPTFEHASAQTKLAACIDGYHRRPGGRGGPGGWWFGSDVDVLFGPHDLLRPDLAGWRRDVVLERPSGMPVRIVPQWVCEILSPSNSTNDTVKKQRVYHRTRVGHYWVVDPMRETLSVRRWTPDGFLEVLSAERGERVRAEPFDAAELAVGVLFGGEDDEE